MIEQDTSKIGDWVRFYSGGRLIIGLVEYVSKNILGDTILHTCQGAVSESGVFERRRE